MAILGDATWQAEHPRFDSQGKDTYPRLMRDRARAYYSAQCDMDVPWRLNPYDQPDSLSDAMVSLLEIRYALQRLRSLNRLAYQIIMLVDVCRPYPLIGETGVRWVSRRRATMEDAAKRYGMSRDAVSLTAEWAWGEVARMVVDGYVREELRNQGRIAGGGGPPADVRQCG